MDQLRLSGPARPGDVLGGRYRLEELIGEGGMGSVWRAADRTLERTVAVKVFWVRAAEESDARRRESEKRLLAAVSHPSLVTLFDAHLTDDAVSFLVMEHIDGGTLASVIDRGPIGLRDAASLATDLGEALHVVHRAGIIHRDVKPANILLRPPLTPDHTFRAVLADFGIAHAIDGTRMTTPGVAMGTVAYISPEQVRGHAPTPASDIYSLGLVLLEALSGVRAFSARTPIEAISARLTASPPIPGQWGYGWRSLLTAMTALDPDARPTAVEVASRARVLDEAPADPALTMPIEMAAADADLTELPRADEPTRALPAPATRVAAAAAVGSSEPASRRSAREAIIDARRRRRRRGRVVGAVALTAAAAVIALTVWVGASVPDPSPPPLPQLERPVNSSSEDVSVPAMESGPATEPVVEPAPRHEPVASRATTTDPVPLGAGGNQNAGPGNNSGNGGNNNSGNGGNNNSGNGAVNNSGNGNGAGKGKGG